jgi:hypothetical protein
LQSPQETFDDYGLFHPELITVLGAMQRSAARRGDRSFSTMIRRTCAAIRDLNAKARSAVISGNMRAPACVARNWRGRCPALIG